MVENSKKCFRQSTILGQLPIFWGITCVKQRKINENQNQNPKSFINKNMRVNVIVPVCICWRSHTPCAQVRRVSSINLFFSHVCGSSAARLLSRRRSNIMLCSRLSTVLWEATTTAYKQTDDPNMIDNLTGYHGTVNRIKNYNIRFLKIFDVPIFKKKYSTPFFRSLVFTENTITGNLKKVF